MKKFDKKGFTLIEVVVTIAILAVMATIGTIAVGGKITKANKERLDSYAQTIAKKADEMFDNAYRKGKLPAEILTEVSTDAVVKAVGLNTTEYDVDITKVGVTESRITGTPEVTYRAETVKINKVGKPLDDPSAGIYKRAD